MFSLTNWRWMPAAALLATLSLIGAVWLTFSIRRTVSDRERLLGVTTSIRGVVASLAPLSSQVDRSTNAEWAALATDAQQSLRSVKRAAPEDRAILLLAADTERLLLESASLRGDEPTSDASLRNLLGEATRNWNRVLVRTMEDLIALQQSPVEYWLVVCRLSVLGISVTVALLLFGYTRGRGVAEQGQALEQHLPIGYYQVGSDKALTHLNPVFRSMLRLSPQAGNISVADIAFDSTEWDRQAGVAAQSLGPVSFPLLWRAGESSPLVTEHHILALHDNTGAVCGFRAWVVDLTPVQKVKAEVEEWKKEVATAGVEAARLRSELASQIAAASESERRALLAADRKTAVLANLCRQVRLPLNCLLRLRNRLPSLFNEEEREVLTAALDAADDLMPRLDGILAYAKLSRAGVEFARTPFRLRNALDLTLERVAPIAEQKGLHLTLLVHPDVPDAYLGDETRLREMLGELLKNAVDYSDSGDVSLRVAVDRRDDSQVWLRMELEDSGRGIPPDLAPIVFEPFANADGAEGRHAGVGLAIAKEIAERFGGHISVKSELHQGSLFHLSFPLPVNPDAAITPDPSLDAVKGLSALLVDHTPSCRGVISNLLTSWGLRTVAAECTASALDLLRQAVRDGHPFPIAVIDADVADIGGIALTQAILDEPDLSSTRIILIVPHSLRSWRSEPIVEGLCSVVSKPVRESELELGILACVRSQKPVEVPEKSPRRILIAEDDPVNQMVASRLIEKMGYTADIVKSGSEAVYAAGTRRYDLILMDCKMPEMDGFAATAAIRNLSDAVRRTPIIALTASSLVGDRQRCLASGMNDYISKPFTYEDLRAAVLRWSGREAPPPKSQPNV